MNRETLCETHLGTQNLKHLYVNSVCSVPRVCPQCFTLNVLVVAYNKAEVIVLEQINFGAVIGP